MNSNVKSLRQRSCKITNLAKIPILISYSSLPLVENLLLKNEQHILMMSSTLCLQHTQIKPPPVHSLWKQVQSTVVVAATHLVVNQNLFEIRISIAQDMRLMLSLFCYADAVETKKKENRPENGRLWRFKAACPLDWRWRVVFYVGYHQAYQATISCILYLHHIASVVNTVWCYTYIQIHPLIFPL